jgi:hypothetical protein
MKPVLANGQKFQVAATREAEVNKSVWEVEVGRREALLATWPVVDNSKEMHPILPQAELLVTDFTDISYKITFL